MADQNTKTGVVVDKNKSAEQYMKEAEAFYIVPKLVREKFSDLVKLIYETESMNGEEAEYWLQIMPIMSEEQIVKFREILVNEKNQLDKLDKDYEAEMNKAGSIQSAQIDETKLKERLQNIKQAEAAQEVLDKQKEEDLLKQLESL